ncbi:MAG: glycerate kinase type-2 family protein [Christensenellales bacterium]|jgi:glycerate 2-kinase
MLRDDAEKIINNAIASASPDEAVKRALSEINLTGVNKLVLISIGKAAWQMAYAAKNYLGERIDAGIVITKYEHSKGKLANIKICEAGHPIPDENGIKATEKAIDLVENLGENDAVLFLISGGGSALFEKPLIPLEELKDITNQMLAKGCSIQEINTIRKRLSDVKGGKFALKCKPAKVYSIVLSDILGDPMDMIASGPACPDSSTAQDAIDIIKKYNLNLSKNALQLMHKETPKNLDNVKSFVTGSVKQLCVSAEQTAKELGYEPIVLTTTLSCEAKEAGSFLASIAQYYQEKEKSLAFILGGETVVRVSGSGRGGRNQELALSSAQGLSICKDSAIFSVGSDGTDGPTDAAGAYVDNFSFKKLLLNGIDPFEVLKNNDSYSALSAIGALIFTGPTGTNVNDLTVLLIKR